MSRIFVIFSFLTQEELKKIHYLLLADELHDEDLATRLNDWLCEDNRDEQISKILNDDFGCDGLAKDLYYGIKYYGYKKNGPNEPSAYKEFGRFYNQVKNMSSNKYQKFTEELQKNYKPE